MPSALPVHSRTTRRTAGLAALALALGTAGTLAVAAPAGASAVGPDPTFTATATPLPGTGPLIQHLAQLNGDASLDIVTSNQSGFTVELNNGDGTFAAPVLYSANGGFDVAVGDVDGDGIVDVVTSGSGQISVHLGAGDGAFATGAVVSPLAGSGGGFGANSLQDYNNDGTLDLATSNAGNAVDIYVGDGLGGFGLFRSLTVAGSRYPIAIDGADVNRDGIGDIFVGPYGMGGGTAVLLSTGPLTFTELNFPGGNLTYGFADFDADGFLDVAYGSARATSTDPAVDAGVRLFDPATQTFGPAIPLAAGEYRGAAGGDFNGDGHADAALADFGALRVFNGDGTGLFTEAAPTTGTLGDVYDLAAGDLNADGRLDVVTTSYQSPPQTTVLLNTTVPPVAPVVTTQPQSQTVDSGQSVTFAAASDDPDATVQWQYSPNRDGSFVDIDGATGPSYTTPPLVSADTGLQYRAVFTNATGSTTSDAATVTVNGTAPAITGQPADQTVTEGQTATFTVTIDGDPTPTVQWQVSTDGGTTFTSVDGATGTSYTTPATVRADHASQYRAVVTNSEGTVTSLGAQLTVEYAPGVLRDPADASVAEGQTASFDVDFDAIPPATVQWQVSVDGGTTFVDLAGATSQTYTTGPTTVADDGSLYRAVATNTVGSTSSRSALLTVSANAPVVTGQPGDQTVASGGAATFIVAYTSSTPTAVQWQASTDNGSTYVDLPGENSDTLTVAQVRFADSGTLYRAVLTNTGGPTTTDPALLTVQAAAPQVTDQPSSQTVNEGQQVTFTAAASGDPTPTVQWQTSTDGGTTFTDVPGATSASFTFTAAAGQDGDLFRAVFTNPGGTVTTDAAALTVNTAPAVTGQPADQSVQEGTAVTFTATADGQPAPTVQWQVSVDGVTFADVAGATSGSYTFTASLADDGNAYRAVFTNTAGTATTRAAFLTVIAAPAPNPTPEPTVPPTVEPTPEPTVPPTTEPTPEPTVPPTTEPTPEPTVPPTIEPTPEPTVPPTTEPTPEPTVEPTPEPTEPTQEPTVVTREDITASTAVDGPVTVDLGAGPGDIVALTDQPAHGTAVLNADGTVTYTPDSGYAGVDAFSYEITRQDGTVTVGTVTLQVGKLATTGQNSQAAVGLALILVIGGGVLTAFAARRRKAVM